MRGWQKQRVAAAIQSPLGCAVVSSCWLLLFMIVFLAIGGHHGNRLLHFGPSELLYFFTVHINTWARWFWLTVFLVADAVVQAWSANIMTPWLTNSVYAQSADGGVSYLVDYRHGTTLLVVTVYQLWASTRQFLPFYLAFTQLDLLVVRIVAEVLVSAITGWAAIREKRLGSGMIDLDAQFDQSLDYLDEYDPNDRTWRAALRHQWHRLRWWLRPAPARLDSVAGSAIDGAPVLSLPHGRAGSARSLTDHENPDLTRDLPAAFMRD